MAAYSVATGKHTTLVAATEDTVTLTARGTTLVVRNRAALGGAVLYFRYDGTAAAVAADDSYVCLPGEAIEIMSQGGFPSAVSLISSGTPDYSVELH